MFGLHKKSNQASKLQQDVYYPFKTVLEKKQLIFGDKKHFSSIGFDFVQKQRNQRKRQNKFDDDEKMVRNGDRLFSKTKRSNCDVLDRNELQTYASLEKMLHKAIFAIQQLKKKGNTDTSSAPKQQCKFSPLSNSDLKTNVFSFDKSKAVKPTSKAHSTRCFKCHRIGHYANKCQNQKPLVTLENENVETEPEKEGLLPIFDDCAHKPMAGSSELIFQFEKNSKKVLNKNEFSGPLNAFDIGAYMTLVLEALCQYMKGQMKNKTVVIKQTKTDFLPFKSWTKLKVSNVLIMILLLITLFLLMFHLFEEGVNDAPQSMEPARHGDQDVLNDSTEVRPSDSTNQTNRAVYRIDLHSSKMEFRLKPRSDDQTDRTTTRFSRPPDILRTIVEPDLSWIVKNPKTDMHSHPANHPDSPACALLLTALDTTSSDEPRQ